jgi:hypothetical protein
MKLTQGERNTAVWAKIEQYAREKLDVLRKKNDAPLTDLQTAQIRGRIAELKDLLDIAEDVKVVDG